MKKLAFAERGKDAASFAADRLILFVVALLGVAGIVLLKLDAPPLTSQLSETGFVLTFGGAVWAAALLLAYAFLVRVTSHHQVEPEITGDNCYYLGFFFTLVSLAITLYELREFNGDKELLNNIISGFGIALISTIVGIALRVWFFQQRTDPVAIDRITRNETQKAVREFRAALSDSSRRLKTFATETAQLTAERDRRIRYSTEKAVDIQLDAAKRVVEKFDDFVNSYRQSMQDSNKMLSETIKETLTDGLQRLSDDIKSSLIDPAATAFAALEKSSRSLALEMDRFREKDLQSVALAAEETAKMLKRSNQKAEEIAAEREKILTESAIKSTEIQAKAIQRIVAEAEAVTIAQRKNIESSSQELTATVKSSLNKGIGRVEREINVNLLGPAMDTFTEFLETCRQLVKNLDHLQTNELGQASALSKEIFETWQELHKSTQMHIEVSSRVIKQLQELQELSAKTVTSDGDNSSRLPINQ